ncbi:unnamed protein product [Trifolium pratense]|uniref:Uncharacterized protein n=1 Tax=Trifolium pratense TaxID=57577 RepID=A0ACB0LCM6_TRIPR|nr:unnamed protein product [Trifolium pratense]
MGDQSVTKTEFYGAMTALTAAITALTTQVTTLSNNNRNYNSNRNNNNNRNVDNNRNNPSTDDSSYEDEEVVSEDGGEENPTRIKKIVLCKSGDPQLDVDLPVAAPSKPDVFVRNPATTSPPLEPPDTRMTSISAKPPHHSRHIELKDLLIDRVQFGFYLKSYGLGTSSNLLTELGQIPFCDKFPIMCSIFEQWNLGGHLDVLTRDRSSHLIQWDPGGWSLVHWRSQPAKEALYQEENSGSSSFEVEETDVGEFP